MTDLLSSIAALLRADFAKEADSGFPTVSRIPSTEAVRFFATLEPAERQPFLKYGILCHAITFPEQHLETIRVLGSHQAVLR